jgi:hypothetical protein
MTIGERVIESISNSVRMLLVENQDDLDKAYLKAEGALGITIGVKLKPDENLTGNVEIDTNLSFVLEKVKASMSTTINENQLELFGEDKA